MSRYKHQRYVRLLLVVLLTIGLGACSRSHRGTSDGGPGLAVASAVTSAARPTLPLEPPAPLPDMKDVPTYEAALGADATYQAIWTADHRDDRDLLLTGVSEILESLDATGKHTAIRKGTGDALKKRKLLDAALKFASWLPATGTFPTEFRSQVARTLGELRSERHLGVWRETTTTNGGVDFAALAFWLNRESVEYAREFLAAKRVGPNRWLHHAQPPLRPQLANEIDALEWLHLLGPLSSDEQSRLDDLRASPLKDDPGEEISLNKLLSEYRDNEVRADGAFKGHVVRFAGTVMEVKNGIGGIYVIIGNGGEYETHQVQCFVDDKFAKQAAALSRGRA